ncbi:hypothetical protein VTI74DRAFT_5560 [Chaetomium olivicolor]
MATAQQSVFKFGIEIELLLESCNEQHKKWDDLAGNLSQRLSDAGLPNQIDMANDYSQWSLVREVTIQGKPDQHGIELVSPVYTATASSLFHSDLSTLFTTLTTHFRIHSAPSCSSHIHISRTPPLSPLETASLAKATLYFESALNALMPPVRRKRDSYWAKSNRCVDNPALAGLSLSQCLAKVEDAAAAAPGCLGVDPRPVVEVMNMLSRTTTYAIVKGRKEDFVRGKTYRWDFTGLLSSASEGDVVERGILGTVEFRQPPGSGSAEEAVGWVSLGVMFVVGAVEGGWETGGAGVAAEGGSLEELRALVERGREVIGWKKENMGSLDRLFRRVGHLYS